MDSGKIDTPAHFCWHSYYVDRFPSLYQFYLSYLEEMDLFTKTAEILACSG